MYVYLCVGDIPARYYYTNKKRAVKEKHKSTSA